MVCVTVACSVSSPAGKAALSRTAETTAAAAFKVEQVTVELQAVCLWQGCRPLLQDLTLRLEAGQRWVVLGRNGSGKTALGQLLCGLRQPHQGLCRRPPRTALVAFEQIDRILENERYQDDSDFVGGCDPGTLARDFLLQQTDAAVAGQLPQLARRLGLEALLQRGIRFLSTGEMRKLVLLQALCRQPQLLVLDEPFDGLDAPTCQTLTRLIDEVAAQGVQVLLLLNRLSDVPAATSHLACLHGGLLVASGPLPQMLRSSALQRLQQFGQIRPEQLPGALAPTEPLQLPPHEPLLQLRRVQVRYGERFILRDLDWTVWPGEHWRISGPNGAGKSTLLALISGDNAQAYANDIRLFGRRKGSGESLWQIRRHLGLVSTALQQDYRVGVTARLAVLSGFFDSIGVYRACSRQQDQIARAWLNVLQLADQAERPLRQLSYGEQRLVLLARALVKQPPLLILDEPCQGLDDLNRAMVLQLIDLLGRTGGCQLLYVSHRAEDHLPCVRHHLQLVPAADGGFTGRIL